MSPRRPRKPCAAANCRELIEAGERFCPEHLQKERRRVDGERGSSAERGYGYRWQKYTRWYKMQHPLCIECQKEGRVTPAFAVDHIEPVNGPDDPKFWDFENHQPLCERHHNQKTAREKGWGR